MIKVKVGNEERDASAVDESWLRNQIEGRRADGRPPCVRVAIKAGDIDVMLSTPGCDRSAPSARRPRREEQNIFDEWEACGMNDVNFSVTDLRNFLARVKSSS
jgi:hypothetical protein